MVSQSLCANRGCRLTDLRAQLTQTGWGPGTLVVRAIAVDGGASAAAGAFGAAGVLCHVVTMLRVRVCMAAAATIADVSSGPGGAGMAGITTVYNSYD